MEEKCTPLQNNEDKLTRKYVYYKDMVFLYQ